MHDPAAAMPSGEIQVNDFEALATFGQLFPMGYGKIHLTGLLDVLGVQLPPLARRAKLFFAADLQE